MWVKRKKLILATLGSVLIHVLVLVFFAVVFGWPPPSAKAKRADQPLRLQIVHENRPPPALAARPSPPPRRLIDATDLNAAATPPPDAQAVADKNTAASSELAPTGDQALPSQNGKAIPQLGFDTHPYVAADNSAAQQPVATPVPETAPPLPKPDTHAALPADTPPPNAAANAPPQPTAAPDEFALETPPPTPKPPDFDPFVRDPTTEPPKPTPAVAVATRPSRALNAEEKSLIHGNLSTRGPSSVAALATPEGRYSKAVSDAIRLRWNAQINQQMDMVSLGTVKIHFSVDRRGKVVAPRVVSNSGNDALATISLAAVMEAAIPPVPPDVIPDGKSPDLPLDFDFSLY